MPTYDRLRNNRPVLLEFIPGETFEAFPYKDRYTLSIVTQGFVHFLFMKRNFL